MLNYCIPRGTCYRPCKVSPYFIDLAMYHHVTIYSHDKAMGYIKNVSDIANIPPDFERPLKASAGLLSTYTTPRIHT